MKRSLNILGGVLGLLVLGVLAFILIATLNGLQVEQAPITSQSPLQSPTPPKGSTATPVPVPAFTPTARPPISPLPTPSPTPEILPTISGPFPPGPKVVYSENIHDGTVTFWAASPVNPAYRTPLAKGYDPNDFGTREALSPDGKMIAYTALPEWNYNNRMAADLWLVTTDGSEAQLLAKGVDIGGPGYPYWSPDSRYIAFVRSREYSAETEDIYEATVWMIDVTTGIETMVEHPTDSVSDRKYAWPIGWVKDGAGFYYKYISGKEYIVKKFSLKDKKSSSVISLPLFTKRCALSPNSTQLLCTILVDRENNRYNLTNFSLQDETHSNIIRQFQEESFVSIWGPGEQSITINENVSAAENATLQVVEVDTKNVVDMSLPASGNYLPQSWSPNGEWLAAQSMSEVHGDLYFFSGDGKTVNHLPTYGVTRVLGWITIDLLSK